MINKVEIRITALEPLELPLEDVIDVHTADGRRQRVVDAGHVLLTPAQSRQAPLLSIVSDLDCVKPVDKVVIILLELKAGASLKRGSGGRRILRRRRLTAVDWVQRTGRPLIPVAGGEGSGGGGDHSLLSNSPSQAVFVLGDNDGRGRVPPRAAGGMVLVARGAARSV